MSINKLKKISTYLLGALIVFLPWQTRLILIPGELKNSFWEYGTVSLYALDFLMMFFLFVSSGYLILQYEKEKKIWTLGTLLALFILLIAFLSLNFSTNHLAGLFWLIKLSEAVLFFLVITQLKPNFKIVNKSLVIAGVLQGILAIYQGITQQVFASPWLGMSAQLPGTLGVQVVETATARILRSYGSLPHPNMLAGFLVITILAAIFLLMTQKKYWQQGFLFLALLIMSAGLWLTFARQALLALGIVILLTIGYTFISKKIFPKNLTLGMLAVVFPLVILSLIFPQTILTRVSAQTRLEQKSLQERQDYTRDALKILQKNWITGVAIGNYTAYQNRQDQDHHQEQPGWAYQPVHNIYLLVFTELGIFGLLAFLLFLFSLFFKANWQNEAELQGILSLLALLVIGFFDHYLWSLSFGLLLFWLVAGLLESNKSSKA